MWGTEPHWFLRQIEEKWGQERALNCVGSMWRGPRGLGGEGGYRGWRDGLCWALCSLRHNEVRRLEGRPHPPERYGSAFCPLLPVHPDTMKPAMLMDSCGGKTVKVIDQSCVIFWWNKKGHTHLTSCKSSVFILLSWRQRPSGGNVRDQLGSGLMASPFGCMWGKSLTTLRCEVPGPESRMLSKSC